MLSCFNNVLREPTQWGWVVFSMVIFSPLLFIIVKIVSIGFNGGVPPYIRVHISTVMLMSTSVPYKMCVTIRTAEYVLGEKVSMEGP
jgi:hypothetical protein